MAESDDYEKAEYEAAVWVIRLAEEPDDAELQAEFELWKNENRFNAELFDQTQKASDLLEHTTPTTQDRWENKTNPTNLTQLPHQPYLELVSPIKPSAEPPAQHSAATKTLINWRSAAAVILLACLTLVFTPQGQKLRLQADYITSTAEQKTITLDDGSQIYLAPKSAFSVDYSPNERHIHLIKGRAFFAVNPDIVRPFIVNAGGTETTVLGTKFNIQLTEKGSTISVQEGHVRVDDASISPTITEELHTGDRVRITWNEGAIRDQLSPNKVATWRQGELIARNMLMSEVIDNLRSYYKGAIVVQSASFSTLKVSGLYNLNDAETTLNALAAAHGAKVKKISPWLLIVSNKDD